MGPRAKEASLVLCIVLLGCTVALASQHLVPPVYGVKIEPIVTHGSGSGAPPGSESKVGTLLIEATDSSGFIDVGFGGIIGIPYMSGVGVTVVPTGPAPLSPKTYETNSTGGLELSLPPSNYSISFFASADLPINSSVLAPVYQGQTTLLQLVVSSTAYQPLYVDIPANQTDVASAWASSTLELGSPYWLPVSPIPSGTISAAFLDLYYNTSSVVTLNTQAVVFSFEGPVQVPILIDGGSLQQQATGSGQWIDFQPETSVSLSGLASVSLSVYYVQANVTTTAPVSTVEYGGISAAD